MYLTLPLTHTDTIILTCNVYFAHSSWEWPVILTCNVCLAHSSWEWPVILTCNVYFAHSSWEWPVLRTSDLLCVVAENWMRTDDYSTRSTLTNTGTSVPVYCLYQCTVCSISFVPR